MAEDFLTVAGIGLEERGATVLHGINFRQRRGQKLALAGESGAGKSTVLQVVAGLVQPTAGEVHFAGRRVKGPQEVLVPGHPGIVYLSQKSELPRSLRVEQVLRYANTQPAARAQAVYEVCRISHLAARRTNELSGGEQQRVALARLLLSAPQLLLLDEPFSNLDREHKKLLQTIIQELGEQMGITCLLVSHDPADTLPWADEILVLHRGQLVQQGTPQQVYRQPATEYVAGLFGGYSLVRGATLAALAAGSPIPIASQALLIRPEELLVRPATTRAGVLATVRAARFLGSYTELELQLPEAIVNARTTQTGFGPGSSVRVSLADGGGWYVPV